MDPKSNHELAEYILSEVGGPLNVASFTNCMTRLRITLRNAHLADVAALKQTDGVLGVVSADDGVQVILGPGKVTKVTEAFGAAMTAAGGGAVRTAVIDENLPPDLADRTRAELKAKQTSWIQRALRHIGNIFIPLIPGFVGCGLIVGITSVITNLVTSGRLDDAILQQDFFRLFAAVGGLLLGTLGVFVGINSAKEFGGTEVLGGLAGLLVYAPVLLPTEPDGAGGISPITIFGFNLDLRPGLGGLLGVIIAVFVWTRIEKWARSWCPEAVDLMVVPLVTIILGTLFTVFVVMPIAGFIMGGITWFLVDIALDQLGIIGGYLLAATFLPLVTIGLHQGLTPVHIELIQETGQTRLLPVLACAGAAQFGAALAIYFKTRDHGLRKRIGAGAPVGFLGVGEPLIYGVTLPLGRPFIAACLAAGFGGIWMSVNKIGALAVGLSGEALLPLIADGKYLQYFIGLLICYAAGFTITYTWGFKEEMVQKLYA
jgi:PTS system sucrose-specific IIC component